MTATLSLIETAIPRIEPACREATRTIRVGVLGLGRVGQAFARLCAQHRETLRSRGLDVRVTRALVRNGRKDRGDIGRRTLVVDDRAAFLDARYDVVVEALGGVEPARELVDALLARGTPVVTANKSLLAAHGPALRVRAAHSGVSLRCEAAALAGIPLLGTLARRPLAASIERLAGVVNGTSNFILTSIARDGLSFDAALHQAQQCGFAEPNPSNDVLGVDACEKLVVLLQHIGAAGVRPAAIETRGICNLTSADFELAAELGGVIKPVVQASIDGDRVRAFVGPAFLRADDPLASIEGEQNGLRIYGRLIGELLHVGPGAGPDITAAAILDDVLEIANESPRPLPTQQLFESPSPARVDSPETPWLLHIHFRGTVPSPVDLAALLGADGVWIRRTGDGRRIAGGQQIGLLAHSCSRTRIESAIATLQSATECRVNAIRVLED
jgi:homoserine dehydrogenase